jgi:DNA-binding transcriptional LysR family regulator
MAMDWDKLRVFHAVAEAGSFTHAGEALNLSQSAVSRQISALEESVSMPLFHRHARGLILTEQGELLFRTAREVFAKLAMAEGLISESKDRPKGPLKITTTVAFGSVWLTPSSSTIPSSICRCARPMSRSACRRRASPI